VTRIVQRLRSWLVALAFVVAAGFAVRTARADDDGPPQLPQDVILSDGATRPELPPLPSDFETLDGGWIQVASPTSMHERIVPLVLEATEFRTRLSADLGQPVLDRIFVRIVRNPEQMAELAPRGAPPFSYATAMAYPSVRLIMVSLRAPDTFEAPDLSESLRHELSHLALTDAIGGRPVPRWFNEGLAIRQSGEIPYGRLYTLWNASLSKTLIPLHDLDASFPSDKLRVSVAYAESADFVTFLMRDADRARFGSLIQRLRAGTTFDRALEDAYGTDGRKLEFQWREEVGRRFGIVPILTGGGLLWGLIIALSAVAWHKRRKRAKAKLEQWAREEAALDAAVHAAARPAPTPEDDVPSRVPSTPVVGHEGRWYTLH
jgi:hypothetical protein